jgi:hypothetical protein
MWRPLALGRAKAHRSASAEQADWLAVWSDSRSRDRPFRLGVIEGPELVPATATLTGPVTGGQRGWPFSLPLTDLGSVGYVAEEFFLDGTAVGYEAEPGTELSVDGRWRVLASRTAPFRTRMLVVRPVTMARFNGVVYVNWQNVTAGFELGTADFESDQLLDGFAWVGVSAQRVGVNGFPGSEQFALRGWDPERYGTLDHPGDDFSFDMYTQATRAIGPAILGGAKAHKLVATGASQSAMTLRTYANAIQPIEQLFDGFFLLLPRNCKSSTPTGRRISNSMRVCSGGGGPPSNQAALGVSVTTRSALRLAARRSRTPMVGTVPPASSRETADWVMPALSASSVWDMPSSSRRARTAWPSS